MTLSDKKLILKDLCARLPYGVFVEDDMQRTYKLEIGNSHLMFLFYNNGDYVDVPIKPFLRQKSSMTAEEWTIYHAFCKEHYLFDYGEVYYDTPESIDYLNEIHVDYRGLINKDLAIEVTEENNPYK